MRVAQRHRSSPSSSGEKAPANAGASLYPYIFRWDRKGRKGQRCRMVNRGGFNSVHVQFEDGYEMVTSGNSLVRARDSKNSVLLTNKTSASKYPSLSDDEVRALR
jgi:hypothetical protein